MLSTFWRFAAGNGNQMCFGLSIQAVLLFAIGSLSLDGFQSLCLKRATNICDSGKGDVQGLTNGRFVETFIHFEQDPRLDQFPSRSYS
jgi:hypothetical protein